MPMPEDFHAALRHVDDAAAEPSPESAPYEGQYRAIEILHKLLSTDLSPAEEAVAKARRGAAYLAVEEPHNAQKDLEDAAAVLFPQLLAYAAQLSEQDDAAASKLDVDAIAQNLPAVHIPTSRHEFLVQILELLNQLGILWSNRAQPLRALCFLLASVRLSEPMRDSLEAAAAAEDDGGQGEEDVHDRDRERERVEAVASARTHAHFYLAQVFGALGRPDASATYCLVTLELQLVALAQRSGGGGGALSFAGAREWIANCLRLVDYYLDTDNLEAAATCLSACEYMLTRHAPEEADGDADGVAEQDEVAEQRAEVFAAWAKVHQTTLQIAALRREGYPAGVHSSSSEATTALPSPSSMQATLATIAAKEAATASTATSASTSTRTWTPAMAFVPASSVTTYEAARDVFKMGVAASAQAKRWLVLDGFVTRHVRVLQQESLLYKRLAVFEPDAKRQIAMQLRRLALLSPLLGAQLNPRAYCDLLQELYFECAEVAADISDRKRGRKPDKGGDKANAYALKAAHCYQQFVALYYSSSDASSDAAASSTLPAAASIPSGSGAKLPAQEMGARETRALLRGYFGLAHVCGKVVYARDAAATASFWKQSLAYHEAVLALARQFDARHADERMAQLFGAELAICRDMAGLLPGKIDQLVYNGRAL